MNNNYIPLSFSISCFMGKQRAGKTLSMVANSYFTFLQIKEIIFDLEHKKILSVTEKERLTRLKKVEIWSNLKLNTKIYGNYKLITANEIMNLYKQNIKIENKLIILDDLFKHIDSRNSMSDENKAFTYFTTEIGKNNNILNYVSHFTTRTEIRLRQMTEFFIWCRKGYFIDLKIGKHKLKDVWIEDKDYYKLANEEELKNMIISQCFFKEYIDFSKDFSLSEKKLELKNYLRGYDFFKHYDTKEII